MTRIHPSAIVDPAANIHPSAEVGPHCVIGPDAVLETGVRLANSVTVLGRARLSENVHVHTGAVIGGAPQILAFEPAKQGGVALGAGVVVREHVTIQCASSPDAVTHVGARSYLMVGVHIPHDCQIGERCVLANNVTFGGHAEIADDVWIGGMAAIHQNSRIGRHAFVAGGSILVGDVIPFGMVVGNHAKLAGLNLTGLKRRGFTRETLGDLRAAYRLLFAGSGSFSDRIVQTVDAYGHRNEVMEIVEFIRSDRPRPLCLAR